MCERMRDSSGFFAWFFFEQEVQCMKEPFSFTLVWYCGSHQIELGLCWAVSNVLIEKNPRSFKKTLTVGFMQRNHCNKINVPHFTLCCLSATGLNPVPLLYLTGVAFGHQHCFSTGRIQNFTILFSFCNYIPLGIVFKTPRDKLYCFQLTAYYVLPKRAYGWVTGRKLLLLF